MENSTHSCLDAQDPNEVPLTHSMHSCRDIQDPNKAPVTNSMPWCWDFSPSTCRSDADLMHSCRDGQLPTRCPSRIQCTRVGASRIPTFACREFNALVTRRLAPMNSIILYEYQHMPSLLPSRWGAFLEAIVSRPTHKSASRHPPVPPCKGSRGWEGSSVIT